MIAWTRTLRGRMIGTVVLGALVSHVVGLAIYSGFNASSLSQAREQLIVERLATAAKLIERLPRERRAETTAALSEPEFRLGLALRSAVDRADSGEADTRNLQERLAHALGQATGERVFADYELTQVRQGATEFETDPPRAVLAERVARWFRFREDLYISFQLSDSTWVNAQVRGRPLGLFVNPGLLWSIGVMVLSVSALTAFAVAKPLAGLDHFARAAEALGTDVTRASPLPEQGPAEISRTARAFNSMRARIRSLIEERTRMLAAMSHDFRTPLTRLRLRAEYMTDTAEKERMLRDVADMEEMVSVSLQFINDGVTAQTQVPTDFVSLLTDVAIDLGLDPPEFRLHGARQIQVLSNPVALRRALTNVLNNARKYAQTVEVRATCHDAEVTVEVIDDGPGIPAAERENVFKPYYRIEPSRSRETGGFGLGLAIAQSIVRAHGGDIILSDASGGGLHVRINLPLA